MGREVGSGSSGVGFLAQALDGYAVELAPPEVLGRRSEAYVELGMWDVILAERVRAGAGAGALDEARSAVVALEGELGLVRAVH